MTMKYLLIVLVNTVVFYIIKITTVLISFALGIEASAASVKYIYPLSLIGLLIQTLLVVIIGIKRKWNLSSIHIIVAIVVVFLLELLSSQEILP